MNRLRWWLVSGAGIPWSLRIGARVSSTHPTGQRACRRPANFIVGEQLIAMFMLITRFFLPNLPPLLALLLPPCFLGFGLGLKQPSGRTLWGDSVLERYTRSSVHADPLRRVALLGSAAMGGEGLDDLRRLIKNVEADLAATAVGCGC
jgi:hypothetical protein